MIAPQSVQTVSIPYCNLTGILVIDKITPPGTYIRSQLRPTEVSFVNNTSISVRVNFSVFHFVTEPVTIPIRCTPESWKRIYPQGVE